MRRRTVIAGLLVLLPVAGACEGPAFSADAQQGIVARAGENVLTVRKAAAMIEQEPELPAREEVVRAMADLWLDYTLLAQAVAEDSTLSGIDLQPVIRQRLEQQMVMELRDSVIQVDTTVTPEELREIWDERAPGTRVKARHILLTFPEGATEEQRDSVHQLALDLRRRVVEDGEGFALLAREHSRDPGSAAQGGDLGWFERGQMVPAFDEAAFALEPGDVSQPVETPFGLHLITVEAKETPNFEEQQDEFARQVKSRRVFEAESTYVAAVEAEADIEPAEDANEIVRRLARDPGVRLAPGARDRALATYDGGVLTAGEYRTFLQSQSPRYRRQVLQATDAQIEALLVDLARGEILVERAREAGMEITPEARDSLESQARAQLQQAARQLGLTNVRPDEGEPQAEAITEAVDRLVQSILADQRNVVPLGALGYSLRRERSAEIYEVAFSRVVEAVERSRNPPGEERDSVERDGAQAPAPARPDTTG